MTKEEAKELLPIIKAFSEGKTIEYRTKGFAGDWKELTQIPNLSFKSYELRIKPSPKYRPFVNAEECWNEMQKHQPFGWVLYKEFKRFSHIQIIDRNELENKVIYINGGWMDLKNVLDLFTFADGTPFGVKEE